MSLLTTMYVESLEQVKGKFRLKKCAHAGCIAWAEYRFRTRTARGNKAEWYVCSLDHVDALATDLARMGLVIL